MTPSAMVVTPVGAPTEQYGTMLEHGTSGADTSAFLRSLYGAASDDGYFVVSTFPSDDAKAAGDTNTVRAFRANEDGFNQAIAHIGPSDDGRRSVFTSMGLFDHPPATGRGKAADIRYLSCLWADVDIGKDGYAKTFEDALAVIDSIGLPPSMVTCSGYGAHAYWIFDEPVPLVGDDAREAVEELLARWKATVCAVAAERGARVDAGTFDLARVMRVAGTINPKHSTAVRSFISRADSGVRHQVADFEPVLREATATTPRQRHRKTYATHDSADLILSADAEPPAEKFEAIIANCPKFSATWERKRPDLSGDQSASVFDQSTANLAVRAGWTDQEIVDTMIAWRRRHGEDLKLDRADYFERTLREAREFMDGRCFVPVKVDDLAQKCAQYARTDLGNAQRLVTRFGQDLRYLPSQKVWLVWDGRRWATDETIRVMDFAKRTVRAIGAEASAIEDEDQRRAHNKFAILSESAARIKAMVELAQSDPGVVVNSSELDRDPWLFNFHNWTMDLRTGQVREHDRSDLITKLAGGDYIEGATLGVFDDFLEHVTGGDTDFEKYLQRAAGYTLTGSTAEEALFMLIGDSRTGKSTFVEALKAALGDYARTASWSSFTSASHGSAGGARSDLARLNGARMVGASEIEDGDTKLAVGLVKSLTGGDTVTARFLYGKDTEFTPTYKLWLAANEAPQIDSSDQAIWNRVRILPFKNVVPPALINPAIKERLRSECVGRQAILAWAVQGAKDWQKQRLGTCLAVAQASQRQRDHVDPVDEFLSQQCVLGGSWRVSSRELRERFTVWSEEYGQDIKWPMVTKKLRSRGCTTVSVRVDGAKSPVDGWAGIALRTDEPQSLLHIGNVGV